MSVKIRTYERQVHQQLLNATSDGLQRATIFYHSKCREAVNRPNSGERRGKSYVYPNPSAPGEPPRKRTGWGQRHVVWEFDKGTMTGRVGVALAGLYMIYLELGTRLIAPRPWLVATLKANLAMIGKLAATGGKR